MSPWPPTVHSSWTARRKSPRRSKITTTAGSGDWQLERQDEMPACPPVTLSCVAATRQSAANSENHIRRRSAETPPRPRSTAQSVSKAWGILSLFLAVACIAQTNDTAARLKALEENLSHLDARVIRQMNELLWFQRLRGRGPPANERLHGPPP